MRASLLVVSLLSACVSAKRSGSPGGADDTGDAVVASDPGGDSAGDAHTASDGAGDAPTGGDLLPGDAGDADAGPLVLNKRHWQLSFADEFRGKPGRADDTYCYDELKPQCHVWAGTSHNCDLTDVTGAGFFPPTKANLVAAIKLFEPAHDFAAMSDDAVKSLYGALLTTRLAHLDKCRWTLYDMLNWMATDYAGHYSARFDPSQVLVDPTGKGTLLLSATYAPVETDCIFGGTLGGPNCQVHTFAPGEVSVGVSYWVDPDPAWPGVYYAPPSPGSCPHGGTFAGVNCQVATFSPHFLEESGVYYWVDADPRWPGVYYANQTYRCRDNIDYAPVLHFRNLTCPIVNGGLMSYGFTNRLYVDPEGTPQPRGVMQQQGRFEAKARIPRGVGAFPAAWLMPRDGGWPYDGGEIDVIEARDAADGVFQTYHHGKCFDGGSLLELDALDPANCASLGGVSTHLAKGYTTAERRVHEFWQRDHLFAVEWTDNRFDYFINNRHIGEITVGTAAQTDVVTPPALSLFDASNFPQSPFYWILNHSTWVAESNWPTFGPQTFRIDYVRNYVACGTDNLEYCPCGGRFREDVGCELHGAPLICPPGLAPPIVTAGVYASLCQPSIRHCINGGTLIGPRCLVAELAPGVLVDGVDYWVDADPRWPGVYYAKVGGLCPHGGSGPVHCQVAAFAADLLESGVSYLVAAMGLPPGVYYLPDFDN